MNKNEVQVDVVSAAEDPVIRALDVSVFGRGDLVNLILQRSEVLPDSPKGVRPVRSWIEGDSAPILSEVDRLGEEIARRVAAVIRAEYLAMRDTVMALGPKRIADIGCGYAIWDLFAARDTGADVVLIDIEENERRHFGFAEEGAAYTSLAGAKAFLTRNGVQEAKVQTLNPREEDLTKIAPVDLAVSFVSCGFHYPVDPYLDFFRDQVTAGGAVLLDLRGVAAKDQAAKLADLGRFEPDLAGHPKARRILLRRAA